MCHVDAALDADLEQHNTFQRPLLNTFRQIHKSLHQSRPSTQILHLDFLHTKLPIDLMICAFNVKQMLRSY